MNALCEHAYAGSLVATKVAVTAETDANQTATAGICKGLTPLCSAAKGNTDTDEVVKYLLDHRTKIVPAKTGKLVFHTEVNMMAVLPQNLLTWLEGVMQSLVVIN